jgi:hypothetical protein
MPSYVLLGIGGGLNDAFPGPVDIAEQRNCCHIKQTTIKLLIVVKSKPKAHASGLAWAASYIEAGRVG